MKHMELKVGGFEVSQEAGSLPMLTLKTHIFVEEIFDVDYYMDIIAKLVKSTITIDKDKDGIYLGTKS